MSKCSEPDIGALLHAYELNALSEEDVERFEIHLLKCEHCFNDVQGFGHGAALIATDNEVKKMVRRADPTDLQSESATRKLWRRLWPETPFVFKPVLAYLLVLFMAIPAYHGLRYAASNDKQIRPLQAITLVSDRSTQEAVFKISSDRDGTISFLFSEAEPDKSYRVVVETEEGKEIERYDNFDDFDRFGMGELFFPLAKMRPGEYRLIITDLTGEYPSNTQEHRFTIED